MFTICDLSDVTPAEILEECGVTAEQYGNTLGCFEKRSPHETSQHLPCEVKIGPYKSVFLKLLKSNMNLQFVTSVYAVLTYLVSFRQV